LQTAGAVKRKLNGAKYIIAINDKSTSVTITTGLCTAVSAMLDNNAEESQNRHQHAS